MIVTPDSEVDGNFHPTLPANGNFFDIDHFNNPLDRYPEVSNHTYYHPKSLLEIYAEENYTVPDFNHHTLYNCGEETTDLYLANFFGDSV